MIELSTHNKYHVSQFYILLNFGTSHFNKWWEFPLSAIPQFILLARRGSTKNWTQRRSKQLSIAGTIPVGANWWEENRTAKDSHAPNQIIWLYEWRHPRFFDYDFYLQNVKEHGFQKFYIKICKFIVVVSSLVPNTSHGQTTSKIYDKIL